LADSGLKQIGRVARHQETNRRARCHLPRTGGQTSQSFWNDLANLALQTIWPCYRRGDAPMTLLAAFLVCVAQPSLSLTPFDALQAGIENFRSTQGRQKAAARMVLCVSRVPFAIVDS